MLEVRKRAPVEANKTELHSSKKRKETNLLQNGNQSAVLQVMNVVI